MSRAVVELAKKLNISAENCQKIVNDLGLSIDYQRIWASGYEGAEEYIYPWDAQMQCCCGTWIAPHGEYCGNPCADCGQSTRCYECALGGGECTKDDDDDADDDDEENENSD